MPKVSVGRDRLFKALGRSNYTKDEFEDLCMRYGLELDDVTTEKAIIRKEMHLGDEEATEDEEVIYIVEVPAHRYDLLCLEGLVQALRIFMELDEIPTYTVANVPKESMLKVHVKPETSSIRPFIVCAVLRGITFDEARYKSFIDLQDKLHQNVCRKRTLVAIGTHDLDTLQGPFTYEALLPTEIDFVPLKQEKSFRADELMKFYESDTKLKKFLHIIEKSPVFPVIYDSKRTVLSLPPIINGAHSAITLQTKNVLIECTATDLTKAEIVLKTMVTMFSMYCEHKFEVEPVEVVGTSVKFYPDLSTSNMEVPLSEVTSKIGVSAEATQVISCLKKMQLRAVQGLSGDKECKIVLSIPPTRTDILQSCDVAENFAIAYGFNNITRTMPKIPTQGRHQLLSQISYLIRLEIALAGFTEVLTWILCSNKENFSMLDRKDEKSTAVIVGNPRSSDFEACRTNLMAGLLKTMRENNHHPKPIKIFEVGDVVLLDKGKDIGATNRRRIAALYSGEDSGFEIIYALVLRVLQMLNIPCKPTEGYSIAASSEPEFLPDRQANVTLKGKYVGTFGIVHPEVLNNFSLSYPCSLMELDLELLV